MSATEAQIRSWVASSGRNWDQKCAAFCYQICNRFGSVSASYGSANIARANSKIVSKVASKAPAAAFHFWAIGEFGHVAIGLGGERVIMGSKYVDTVVGINAGITTVSRYTTRTGATYLGWSNAYGKDDFTFVTPTPAISSDQANVKKVAKYLNGLKLGWTTTAVNDGVRGPNYWKEVQKWSKLHNGYTGPIDGVPGTQSRAGEKVLIKKVG